MLRNKLVSSYYYKEKDELLARMRRQRIFAGISVVALLTAVLLSIGLVYLEVTSPSVSASAHVAAAAGTKAQGGVKQAKIAPTKKAQPTPTPPATPSPTPTQPNTFVTHIYTDAQGLSMTYYLYVPTNYNPLQKYPLVLLLHGGGERSIAGYTAAEDRTVIFNRKYVQVWGPTYSAPYSPHIQQRWPCFVVIPQIQYPQQWVDTPVPQGSYTMNPQPTPWLQMAKDILDSLQHQYTGIDSNRLYITGLSLGGYGVWDAIERWPNYFAAAAPIAGAGDPSKAAELVNLPIWDFHGSADTVIPVSGSHDMMAAIKAAGGHPRYTEFPGAGHEIWDFVYSLTGTSTRVVGFYTWLFSQSKQVPLKAALCTPSSALLYHSASPMLEVETWLDKTFWGSPASIARSACVGK